MKSQLSEFFIRYDYSACLRNCDKCPYIVKKNVKLVQSEVFDVISFNSLSPFICVSFNEECVSLSVSY